MSEIPVIEDFDPTNVDLTTANPTDIICYFGLGENEYNGNVGARISAIFVILVVSTTVTFIPVVAARVPKFRIPVYVYLFARYFGAGVIIATAFIHLLDPAYAEIGPQTCVGMTGGWSSYSFVVGIVLTSVMVVFLLDFGAKRYVEMKYGIAHGHPDVESTLTNADAHGAHQGLHSGDQNDTQDDVLISLPASTIRAAEKDSIDKCDVEEGSRIARNDAEETAFRQQIAAFLVLEFGVILHSVIIGLNLGTTGDEFSTLYPVLVFHQSFEGLGIGARLSAIPIPKRLSWLPWILCGAYGLVTPVAIAVGLGISTTYNSGSFTANVVSGVLDAISAGILIYTGLVELLARDFLFNPDRSRDNKKLTFMVVSVLFGAGIMALLGKWA